MGHPSLRVTCYLSELLLEGEAGSIHLIVIKYELHDSAMAGVYFWSLPIELPTAIPQVL